MENELYRLRSFCRCWVFMSMEVFSSIVLAQDGFYWCEQSCQVICFYCRRSYCLMHDLTQQFAHETTCRRDEQNISIQNNHDVSTFQTQNTISNVDLDNTEQQAAIEGAVGGCDPEIRLSNQVVTEDTEAARGHNDAGAGRPDRLDSGSTQEGTSRIDTECLLRRENMYLKKRITCKRCEERKIDCIFLPCGHVVCRLCKGSSPTCIVCGQMIEGTWDIYMG